MVVSPLDAYVTARMITLAAPCEALMESEPLTVGPDDLVAEISDQIKDVHYGAAVAVDDGNRPVGLVARSDLVGPERRRIMLVDHAELAQSVPGADQADIVEILDHHHIGSIETHVPVTATFDPVGSTATLVIERFRQNGLEPARPTAMLLLGAILSDTVILNSPTTTERDHAVVDYLEQVLALDATEFGREMFEATSDVSQLPAEEIVTARRQGVRASGRPDDVHRPDRDGGQGPARAPGRADRGDGGRAHRGRARAVRADGHRHPEQGNRPSRGRRPRPGRARLRPAVEQRRRSSCRAS